MDVIFILFCVIFLKSFFIKITPSKYYLFPEMCPTQWMCLTSCDMQNRKVHFLKKNTQVLNFENIKILSKNNRGKPIRTVYNNLERQFANHLLCSELLWGSSPKWQQFDWQIVELQKLIFGISIKRLSAIP